MRLLARLVMAGLSHHTMKITLHKLYEDLWGGGQPGLTGGAGSAKPRNFKHFHFPMKEPFYAHPFISSGNESG